MTPKRSILFLDYQKLSRLPPQQDEEEPDEVEVAYLRGNCLRQVPQDLFKRLPRLKELHVGGNDLKELPEELFIKLSVLFADGNGIERIPSISVKDCQSSLTKLDLSDNFLEDVPESLGLLRNIRDLNLARNMLSRFPQAVALLENLEVLNLARNQITTVPEFISNCRSLRGLMLDCNRLRRLPRAVAAIPKLRFLNVANNDLVSLPLLPFPAAARLVCDDNPRLRCLPSHLAGGYRHSSGKGQRDEEDIAEVELECDGVLRPAEAAMSEEERTALERGGFRELTEDVDCLGEIDLWIDLEWTADTRILPSKSSLVPMAVPPLFELCMRVIHGRIPTHQLPNDIQRKFAQGPSCYCQNKYCFKPLFSSCFLAFKSMTLDPLPWPSPLSGPHRLEDAVTIPSVYTFCSVGCKLESLMK